MRRFFICHLLLLIVIITLSGCTDRHRSVPAYPVDAAAVQTALETVQLSWIIDEEQSWLDGHMAYTLHDEDGKIICNISSADDSGERILKIGFMPSYYDEYDKMRSLSDEEWEAAIIFGTILYGGFEHESAVFDEFSSGYPADAAAIQEAESSSEGSFSYDELYEWTHAWDDTICRIRTGRMKKDSSPLEVLSVDFCGAEAKD